MSDLLPTVVVTDADSGQAVTITDELRLEARRVHEDIVHHGTRSLEHLKSLATSLAHMRDARLYLGLGHQSFEAYCRQEIGLSRDWADSQIQAGAVLVDVADAHRQIPSKTHLKLLGRLPLSERRVFLEQNDVSEMSTRQLEDAVRQANQARKDADEAKRREEEARQAAAAAERRAKDAESRAKAAESKPPQVVERVVERTITMPDPRQQVEMDRLRKEVKQATEQYNSLLAKAQGTAEEERKLKDARKRVEAIEQRLQRIGVQFDDEGRDPYGGSKLMDALDPIFRPVSNAVAQARVLKKTGVGGQCDDNAIAALVPQLRELAGNLEEILNDRKSRPIKITPVEVQ